MWVLTVCGPFSDDDKSKFEGERSGRRNCCAAELGSRRLDVASSGVVRETQNEGDILVVLAERAPVKAIALTGSERGNGIVFAMDLEYRRFMDQVCKFRPTDQAGSNDIAFFLTLCGSFAVSEVLAMGGHANEIEMVARSRGQSTGCRAHR